MSIYLKTTSILFIVVFGLILTGCGIDDYIFLHPVEISLNNPSNSQELNTQYFLFRTKDEKNSSNDPVNFKGYEIYYRIYNSKITLNQDVAKISSTAEKSSGLIFNWLKDSMKYHRLSCVTNTFTIPLVSSADEDREVYIRLINFDDTVISRVLVGNLNISSPADQSEKIPLLINTESDFGKPLRTESNGTTSINIENSRYFFDFENINPEDSDVTFTKQSETIMQWYVQAYVFAYGYDSSYNSIYSSYFPLGYITISK